MARKLKVFQAQFGFYDSVVAASSQAAALEAWGTHQNLFADGQAKITTDEAAVSAALAHPETPLLRAVGTNDAFQLKPASLPKPPPAAKPRAAKAAKTQPKAAPKPAPDRAALDATEAAQRKLDEDRKRAEARLQQRRDDLDAEMAEAQRLYVERHKAVAQALAEARQAYRRAGGED